MSLTRASAAVIKTEEIVNNRNLIINGAMQIAQRGTQSITSNDQTLYGSCDRWKIDGNPPSSRGDLKQTADAPTGFSRCFELDVTTAGTPTSTYYGNISQRIEGLNLQHLEWGTASAKPLTLSFWVKSNLTGNLTVSLGFTDDNVGCYEIYTINNANTWEYKTITFPGYTLRSIDNDNNDSLGVYFCHSAFESNRTVSTRGSWISNIGFALINANQNIWASTDNYLKITGVQLEVGSVATPFERRPFGMELALCQRYFQVLRSSSVLAGRAGSTSVISVGIPLSVPLRGTPTMSNGGTAYAYSGSARIDAVGSTFTADTVGQYDVNMSAARAGFTGLTDDRIYNMLFASSVTLSAEL